MPTIPLASPEAQYLAQRDWRLACLMRRVGDLRYERYSSAFAQLSHSVIEQMLSMKAGDTIRGRLEEACGGAITPEAVRALSLDQVRSCGMARRKAETLLALAHTWTDESLDALADEPDDEVRRLLCQTRGVGRWTADMFLLFHLGRPDVLPLEDGAVRQSFLWLYGVPITTPEAQALVCDLWHPQASLAVRYLYRALNQGLVAAGSSCQVLGW